MTAPDVKHLLDWYIPTHYDLHISIDPKLDSFKGFVTITGTPTQKALHDKKIFLHTVDLKISAIYLGNISASYSDENRDEIAISLPDEEHANEITVEFSGKITEQMHGIYPSFYNDNGQRKTLIATQFESHHAREAFPCIDEPSAKATFALKLTCPTDGIALSNTPLLESPEIIEGAKTYCFEKTPKMSTYLLAWVWGDFVSESIRTNNGREISLYATRQQSGKATFALGVASRALDYLESYFDTSYPLQKCDLVALPDFAASAMENWGLITFREESLLIDGQSDLHDKQYCANVVIHELAHQWFGNLVTMKWWNDLWLNEGFASWIPYLVLDELYPEWNMWEQFSTNDLAIGLAADSLEHTHPIVVDIASPDEISSAFDSISYDKGCAVVHMVYLYIGADAFREGLRIYFTRHAYGNAVTYDLWKAWSDASGKDVAKFMQAWTETPGYPLITISSDKDGPVMTQERFGYSPSGSGQIWPIPLHIPLTTSDILSKKHGKLSKYTKVNVGQQGFYRALYQGDAKTYILEQIRQHKLADIDIQGVLADSYETVKANKTDLKDTLEIIDLVKESISEPLLSKALAILMSIRTLLPELYDELKPYVAKYIAPQVKRLGVTQKANESVDDTLLRPSIIALALYTDEPFITRQLRKMFINAIRPEDIQSDIRASVYRAGIMLDQESAHTKLIGWYRETTIPGEQIQIASVLCSVEQRDLFESMLAMIKSEDVRMQDVFIWIGYTLRNRHHRLLAWEWLKTNWAWVLSLYGTEKEIDYILRYAADGFATEEHKNDYVRFFQEQKLQANKRALEQGIETLNWQIRFREVQLQSCRNWLNKIS